MLPLILLVVLIQAGPDAPAPNPLQELYEEAVASMEAGDCSDAITKFETILAEDPAHIPSRFNLAVCFTRTAQTNRAMDAYREILAQDEAVFEAQMNLAILLSEEDSPEEALEEFARAAELHPSDANLVLYQAQLLDRLGRVDEAIAAYEAALAMDSNMGEAHRRIGFLYMDTNRIDEAYEAFLEATRLGITTPSVFVALGDIESDREDFEGARRHYEQANQLVPDDDDIRLRLALVLREQEEFADAIDLLEELPGAESALAEAYLASEMYPEAAAVYERLAEEAPENADYWYLLGKSYFEMDLMDLAVPSLQKSMGIDSERVAGWGTLAAIYLRQEDWVHAGEMLIRYLELEPDHAPSHFGLALSFDKIGDYEQALLHYNKFIELDDGRDDVRSFQVRQRAQSIEDFLN